MPSHVAEPKWNASKSGLSFAWPKMTGGKAPSPKLIDCLKVSATIDGKRISPAKWESGKAQMGGVKLEVKIKKSGAISAKVTNKSSSKISLDRISFSASHAKGVKDFMAVPGKRLRVHKEGLTMATPTASLRYGEKDFELNPEYAPFAVLTPSEYHADVPNKFSGEYAALLNDSESGASALFGFISSTNQFTRVAIDLDKTGVARLEAIAHCDNITVEPGESVESEELAVLASFDAYGLLEDFASLWAKRMKARTWDHTPTGWCSWYYYFSKITEADMVENIRWLKDNKRKFPLEYIQLDDGYQAACGDWLKCNEKFPKGLPFLVKEAKKAGFKSGVWLAPFLVEEGSELYKAHPEWTVKDKDGKTVWAMKWHGANSAVLDCSLQEPCDWLTKTFATLRKWGYDYVKLDFIAMEIGVLSMGGHYANPKMTRAQVLRRGLEAMRKGFGDDRLMMGCTCPFGPEIGVFNAARISTDITPYWQKGEKIFKEAPTVPNVCRNVINRRYMHGRLWLNDPDTHIARIDSNELTESEVKLWTSAIWLTGGSLFLSDRFSTLAPERAELSKLLLQDPDAFTETRPLDFLDREYPAIWFAKRSGKGNSFAIGVFNFESKAKTFKVEIPVKGKFKVREHWSKEDIGTLSKSFEAKVPPHSCKLFHFEA